MMMSTIKTMGLLEDGQATFGNKRKPSKSPPRGKQYASPKKTLANDYLHQSLNLRESMASGGSKLNYNLSSDSDKEPEDVPIRGIELSKIKLLENSSKKSNVISEGHQEIVKKIHVAPQSIREIDISFDSSENESKRSLKKPVKKAKPPVVEHPIQTERSIF